MQPWWNPTDPSYVLCLQSWLLLILWNRLLNIYASAVDFFWLCLCFPCVWLNLNLSCTYVCLLPPWQMVESKLHMRWFRFCSFGELLAAQAVSPVRYLCCFSRFPWSVITSVLSALIPEKKTVTWFGWSLGIIGGLLELLHVVMSV